MQTMRVIVGRFDLLLLYGLFGVIQVVNSLSFFPYQYQYLKGWKTNTRSLFGVRNHYEVAINHFENTTTTLHYFNNAGSSPSTPEVLKVINEHLEREMLEGGYNAANIVRQELEEVYHDVGRLIGSTSDEVALVESATVAWTRVFYSMAQSIFDRALLLFKEQQKHQHEPIQPQERCILISEAEYAANVVAIVKFVREHNDRFGNMVQFSVHAIPSIGKSGIVDVSVLRDVFWGKRDFNWHDLSLTSTSDSESREGNYLKPCKNPEDIALVCITHIPTNSGIINPVNEIGQCIEQFNYGRVSSSGCNDVNCTTGLPPVMYLVDACQSVGQIPIRVKDDMKAHALTATGRKYLRGPRGTGFLYVDSNFIDKIIPSTVDHAAAPITFHHFETNNTASTEKQQYRNSNEIELQIDYKKGAKRFEYWESNISTKLGLGKAIFHCLNNVGINHIETYVVGLASKLRQNLRTIPNVTIYHDDEKNFETQHCGIVTFYVNSLEPEIIKKHMLKPLVETSNYHGANKMDDNTTNHLKSRIQGHRFELSIVPRTSTPIDSAKSGVGDLVRASLSYINSVEEIEIFCDKLKYIMLIHDI